MRKVLRKVDARHALFAAAFSLTIAAFLSARALAGDDASSFGEEFFLLGIGLASSFLGSDMSTDRSV